ncbi:hypothetical protein EYZ11_005297 [Aspergillus tanneri]|uniref:Carboxylic ester hydrolase n=1 Tax=Aspergillus tanneri TaxID=1220188 RepID=A0A4S3JIW9_9EURO|nr:uncharacterized protein ATNIH1004_009136 [Aspergillus tanneri]KAA8644925.1 hypothetical protein ATNIH1004_009136 [Aspergillus tanneri]THC95220.1 hypothetical protein EYZ11_005297 [Aspergillus tanneri]
MGSGVFPTILMALLGLVRGTLVSSASACTAGTFVSLSLSNIEITSFNVTAAYKYSASANSFDGTGGVGVISASTGTTASTVDICLIAMTYTHPGQNDVINTYIGLPLDASDWNSRFLMEGGGGWLAGGESEILSPVLSGYSSSSTDGGHNTSSLATDWGLTSEGNTNWPTLWDFASVAIVEAAVLGKMATEIYFGSAPKYSYWNGCSTGGRQGHMMAQQHPELFDGMVSGAPAINWDKFIPSQFWGPFMAQLLDVQPPSCVLDAFTDAAIGACDLLDGVKDGLIAYPGQCFFQASSLVGQMVNCSNPDENTTITTEMAQLVAAMWEGPRSTEGHFEWYGFDHDSDLTAILNTTCTSVHNCTMTPFGIADDWVKVFLARNSTFNTETLTHPDYDRLFRQSMDQYASVIGTENPDLTNMKLAGTKMIAWHGMQDQLIPTNGSVDYYQRVMEFDTDAESYYRFFLAPGVKHCGGGDGFDPSDTVFGTLRAWVENGTVPDSLEATAKAVGDSKKSATRTAYLCPYPKVFTYTGGNPNQPSSFSCI